MSEVRVALPKGRLLAGVLAALARTGLDFTRANDRDYRPRCSDPAFEAKLLKPRSIPQVVALDRFAVGFCGLDLVRESGYEQVEPLLDLGLNAVEIVVAVPADRRDLLTAPPRRPLLLATEYESLAAHWALGRGLAHITVQTHGSTEAYAPEDADIVIDCVETGRTLEANGLVVVERLFRSTTHLVAGRAALDREPVRRRVDELVERLRRGAP